MQVFLFSLSCFLVVVVVLFCFYKYIGQQNTLLNQTKRAAFQLLNTEAIHFPDLVHPDHVLVFLSYKKRSSHVCSIPNEHVLYTFFTACQAWMVRIAI